MLCTGVPQHLLQEFISKLVALLFSIGLIVIIRRSAHQTELIALADLAGITATPGVFRIATELLALEISPEDIYVLLKQICPRTPSEETTTPNISGTQPPEDEKSEKS
ncbi:hypothetical protein KPH14_005627 [Odynerus spinipes]|uniref:Uncharacterized protein n=1 Tax=Odynerus spinipes TaxID=1348599 RepID=A0AAD9RC03_9HYME|nr:hypothetical protein KPH14_005627 [Odynerus spinipes]